MKKVALLFVLTVSTPLLAGDCPHHAAHVAAEKPAASESGHHDAVDARGDAVMGFSHEKTKHAFVRLDDGGAIEVRANDASDAESVRLIRAHLSEIAALFTKGDFAKPLAIHGKLPDGADAMQRAGNRVTYRYEELERGARVRVSTKENALLEAVHAFMKFQRDEHRH